MEHKFNITTAALIGMIDTMAQSLRHSMNVKNDRAFVNIGASTLEILDGSTCNELPDRLFLDIYNAIYHAYELASSDYDDWFPNHDINLTRAEQPYYADTCNAAIKHLEEAKTQIRKYIIDTIPTKFENRTYTYITTEYEEYA
jgi:hypothetical protein